MLNILLCGLPLPSQQGHAIDIGTPIVWGSKLRLTQEKGHSEPPGRVQTGPTSAVLFSTLDSSQTLPSRPPPGHPHLSHTHILLDMPAFPNPLILYKLHLAFLYCSSCTELSWAPGMAAICAHSTGTEVSSSCSLLLL